MSFTDQHEIPAHVLKQIDFLSSIHCISGYPDGAFYPKCHIHRGEFCKMLVNAVIGKEIYIDLEKMADAGTWKEAMETWAGRYVLFFRTVILTAKKNPRHRKKASVLLNGHVDWDKVITKREAFEWSKMFFETEFSFYCKLKRIAVDDTPAERIWLCQLIYAIFKEAATYFYRKPEKLKKLLLDGVPFTSGERPKLYFLCLDPRVDRKRKCFVQMLKTKWPQAIEHPIWSGSACQYTSLSAVYKMLQAAGEPVNGYPTVSLWLSNTAYLNDPNEGVLFREIMNRKELQAFRRYFDETNLSGETEIGTSEVYVASLSCDKEERLPMWVQYGDWGRGCRIEFEVSERDEFRKLKYYDKKELPLQEAQDYIIGQSSFAVQLILVDLFKKYMEKNGFLYKEKYYEHENEVRILRRAPAKSAKEDTENLRAGEIFPRMHLESYYYMKILSITLGPRCENLEHVALALKKLGVKVVKKSNIQFR